MANKVVNFFKEVKIEMGKVSWPTKDELISSTILVITSMVLFGIIIWICDFIFMRAINFIIRFG